MVVGAAGNSGIVLFSSGILILQKLDIRTDSRQKKNWGLRGRPPARALEGPHLQTYLLFSPMKSFEKRLCSNKTYQYNRNIKTKNEASVKAKVKV